MNLMAYDVEQTLYRASYRLIGLGQSRAGSLLCAGLGGNSKKIARGRKSCRFEGTWNLRYGNRLNPKSATQRTRPRDEGGGAARNPVNVSPRDTIDALSFFPPLRRPSLLKSLDFRARTTLGYTGERTRDELLTAFVRQSASARLP